MNLNDAEHRLDTLSSACHVIPCQPRKRPRTTIRSRQSHSDKHKHQVQDIEKCPFPILHRYEADAIPAHLRYNAYRRAVRSLDQLFESCIQSVYKNLFDDLQQFLNPEPEIDPTYSTDIIPTPQLFIPGFEHIPGAKVQTHASRALTTAFLISSSTPTLASFSQRLVSHITSLQVQDPLQDPFNIIVTLTPGECPNLTSALRAIVNKFVSQSNNFKAEPSADAITSAALKGDADLNLLKQWYLARFVNQKRPKLVLHVPSLEAIDPSVLHDLLYALHVFSDELEQAISSAPAASKTVPAKGSALMLLLGITSPSSGAAAKPGSHASSAPTPWADLIPRKVLQSMDFSRFALPSREAVWMQLVQRFLISRHLPIAIGRRTFEYVRKSFWETDADLDSVLESIRLAVFLHYTRKPESVFSGLDDLHVLTRYAKSWKPEMIDTLRLAMLEVGSASEGETPALWLPRPLSSSSAGQTDSSASAVGPHGPKGFVLKLLESDGFLLQQVTALKPHRDVLAARQEMVIKFLARGFQCLHKLDTAASSGQGGRDTVAEQATNGFIQQREAELAAGMMTLVVSQCLRASTGSVRGDMDPDVNEKEQEDEELVAGPGLTLAEGLSKLCTAARRLESTQFEALLDDFVLFVEEEVAALEADFGEALVECLDEEDVDGDVQMADRGATQGGSSGHEAPAKLIWREMQRFLSTIRTFQQRLSQMVANEGPKGHHPGTLDDQDEKADDGSEGVDEAELQRRNEARLARVQRQLELEERVTSLKREVTDWIVEQVEMRIDWSRLTGTGTGQGSDMGLIGLIKQVWWYDSLEAMSALLDPMPRAAMALSLHQPQALLENLEEALLDTWAEGGAQGEDEVGLCSAVEVDSSNMPDICRMYQLYRDCGKFVNLADWYDAFCQSLELDGETRSASGGAKGTTASARAKGKRKAKHGSNEEEDGDESDSSLTSISSGENRDAVVVAETDDEVPATPSKRGRGRGRGRRRGRLVAGQQGESDSSDEDVLDTPSRRKRVRMDGAALEKEKERTKKRAGREDESVQSRFALAINQMARMGLLRGTRRKHEHVAKLVWDLVPE